MTWRPDYITEEDVKNWERIRADDELDDTEIALYVATASRAIDDHTNRQFGQLATPTEWTYTATFDSERAVWTVSIDDLQDTTGLAVAVRDAGTIDAADYTLEPVNAVAKGKAYTTLTVRLGAAVQPTGRDNEMLLTARWGWTAFPRPVVLGATLQASRFAARRESPYGVAGSPSDGSEMRLLSKLDPDVAVSLRGLLRTRRVA
jgi:hypothetical protein